MKKYLNQTKLSFMKNWVISKNKEIVYKVGEFFIQVTTVEHILEQIYAEFVDEIKIKQEFSKMMLGGKKGKINELSKKIKLGEENKIQEEIKTIKNWEDNKQSTNLKTRLNLMKEFRNKIAHNALEYNPINKQVHIKADEFTKELDPHILHVGELLTDLHIVLTNLREPKMKNWKKVITF